MNKIIRYTRKNGEEVEVNCKGVKGTVLYALIKFINWIEERMKKYE